MSVHGGWNAASPLIDADDWSVFESCGSGPAMFLQSGCAKADFDHDNDVDQADFAVFQRCWSGAEPAEPNCAD